MDMVKAFKKLHDRVSAMQLEAKILREVPMRRRPRRCFYNPSHVYISDKSEKKFCSHECYSSFCYGSDAIIARLLEKSELDGNNCLIFSGSRDKDGYGLIGVRGKNIRVPKLAWELKYEVKVPFGLNVCHTCDKPPCFNPDHLFLGTYLDNMRDCSRKGRIKSLHGSDNPMSALTEQAVITIRNLWETGEYTKTELGNMFHVSVTAASRAIRHDTWRHVL